MDKIAATSSTIKIFWRSCLFHHHVLKYFQYLLFAPQSNRHLVFKSVTNSTYGKQINPLGNSLKILLSFLMKCHITLTCAHGTCSFKTPRDIVSGFLGATSYFFFLKKKKQKKRSYGGQPPCCTTPNGQIKKLKKITGLALGGGQTAPRPTWWLATSTPLLFFFFFIFLVFGFFFFFFKKMTWHPKT
jgi:hypothetical protein